MLSTILGHKVSTFTWGLPKECEFFRRVSLGECETWANRASEKKRYIPAIQKNGWAKKKQGQLGQIIPSETLYNNVPISRKFWA